MKKNRLIALTAASMLALTGCSTVTEATSGVQNTAIEQVTSDIASKGKEKAQEWIDKAEGALSSASSDNAASKGSTSTDVASAVATLDTLTVRTSTDAPKYDREAQFGSWEALGGAKCDARKQVLIDYAQDAVTYDNSPCTLAGGYIMDPYSGERMDIVYGPAASGTKDITVEHVVSVKDAWQSGAYQWSQGERVKFYNDFDNLIPLSRSINSAKSDKTADKWLPSTHEGQCLMVAQQVAVKSKWGLSVTKAEKAAMKDTLSGC